MRMLRVGLRLSNVARIARPANQRALHMLATHTRHQRGLLPLHGGFLATREFSSARLIRKEEQSKKVDSKSVENPKKDESSKDAPAESGEEKAKPKEKLTLWQKVKREASHFWEGSKLLGYEVRVSTKLALKMASGRELSRREDRQLKRTVQDIVRLVPFSMFVLVPFAELLLPIALKLFPNMLPSTFESASAKASKLKKLGNTRKDVGEFLKSTINSSDMAVPKFASPEQKHEFEDFFRQIRDGEKPTRTRMLSVARMFKDDVLLDNFTRPQLAALARYMNIQGFGTSIILRYRIRHKMKMIKQDDRIIEYEGVDSLNSLELISASQSRGFKTIGVSTGRLRDDLSNWLQLRLHDRVPSSLLILSSAYNYGEHNLESSYEGLLAVLSALPPEVYHETELEINSEEVTNAQRLEVLKEQDELIREENKEEQESGHVIQVRDNLNLDEEEPKPTTESEADVKADDYWYQKADVAAEKEADSEAGQKAAHAKKNPEPPTAAEADSKADDFWYKKADEKADAAADKSAEAKALHAKANPEPPTAAEADSKADGFWYKKADDAAFKAAEAKALHAKAHPGPASASEADSSADSYWYKKADEKADAIADHVAEVKALYAKAHPVSATASEADSSADASWYKEADKKIEAVADHVAEAKALYAKAHPVSASVSEADSSADAYWYKKAEEKIDAAADKAAEAKALYAKGHPASATASEADSSADAYWYKQADEKAGSIADHVAEVKALYAKAHPKETTSEADVKADAE